MKSPEPSPKKSLYFKRSGAAKMDFDENYKSIYVDDNEKKVS